MNWAESGYFGVDKVARQNNITRGKAKQLLMENEVYQQTATRRRGPFNTIVASPMRDGRPDQVQGDLLDVSKLARVNKGIRFLVTLVDVYSRRAWILPIKKKATGELMRVLEPWLREYRPYNLTFDKEPGIRSAAVTKLVKELGVKRWFSQDLTNKGATAIVERFNRTVRNWMTRYTLSEGKKYLSGLPKFIRSYNNTYHRTIRMAPIKAWGDNVLRQGITHGFPVGTKVRTKLRLGMFEKASKPQWSAEVFSV